MVIFIIMPDITLREVEDNWKQIRVKSRGLLLRVTVPATCWRTQPSTFSMVHKPLSTTLALVIKKIFYYFCVCVRGQCLHVCKSTCVMECEVREEESVQFPWNWSYEQI